jgi:hypothetical protein
MGNEVLPTPVTARPGSCGLTGRRHVGSHPQVNVWCAAASTFQLPGVARGFTPFFQWNRLRHKTICRPYVAAPHHLVIDGAADTFGACNSPFRQLPDSVGRPGGSGPSRDRRQRGISPIGAAGESDRPAGPRFLSRAARSEPSAALGPTLAAHLGAERRAGTVPLTINLGAVTHLGSAGVKVVADGYRRADSLEIEWLLVAPPRPPRVVAGPVTGSVSSPGQTLIDFVGGRLHPGVSELAGWGRRWVAGITPTATSPGTDATAPRAGDGCRRCAHAASGLPGVARCCRCDGRRGSRRT